MDYIYYKIPNSDCFCGDNFYEEDYIDMNRCFEKVKELNVTVFIIYKNKVYFRRQNAESCIMNMIYYYNSTMYIYLQKNYNSYYIDSEERVKYYTKVLDLSNNVYVKLNTNRLTLENYINNNPESNPKINWYYQHHYNMLTYLEDKDIAFNWAPCDMASGLDTPGFASSRPINYPEKTIILPLQKLYIPNFYSEIFQYDLPFDKKKKTCIWRGAPSSSLTHPSMKERASRFVLADKYYSNKNYNIGFSYISETLSDNVFNKLGIKDMKNALKHSISIKDQLEYMFILSVEGGDFATNLSWIMLSNSVPIMPKPYIETWKCEHKLKEYVHYVPVKNDFSDLDSQMDWCLNNLDKCREIAYMSKLYTLQFFDIEKEETIIKKVIETYTNNVININ